MLEIRNLHARLEDGREILKGIDLSVGDGEVHAIMGPNGSGKSTLAAVLAGREGYEGTAPALNAKPARTHAPVNQRNDRSADRQRGP